MRDKHRFFSRRSDCIISCNNLIVNIRLNGQLSNQNAENGCWQRGMKVKGTDLPDGSKVTFVRIGKT